jgi:hypothetical protein
MVPPDSVSSKLSRNMPELLVPAAISTVVPALLAVKAVEAICQTEFELE